MRGSSRVSEFCFREDPSAGNPGRCGQVTAISEEMFRDQTQLWVLFFSSEQNVSFLTSGKDTSDTIEKDLGLN